MKSSIGIKIAAVAVVAALAGCTNLKPIQAQIDDLKAQAGRNSSDIAALKAEQTQQNTQIAAAASAASAAQATANQALAAAQAAQAGVNDVNEKVDRMFQRSVSK